MNMIDIAALRPLVSAGQILWTEHLSLRLRERGIKRADVIACIGNGEIIEQYPDDYPCSSCLVLGITVNFRYLHVVCGIDGELWIISAYDPAPEKWTDGFRVRKEF